MAQSQCSPRFGCGRFFSGMSAFEAHLAKRTNNCIDPATLGFATRTNAAGDDIWFDPTVEVNIENNTPREIKTYDCPCGNKFRGTGKRGRPPKTCVACGGKGELV